MSYTAPELEAKFKDKMGDALGSLFSYRWGDFIMLHRTWNEYVEMFGADQRRFDLMNDAAPGFFLLVRDAMWHETLLHICRFVDTSRGSGSRVSLPSIPIVEPSLRDELRPLLDEVRQRTAFAKEWRDRKLAHTDEDVAIEKKPLAHASREAVKKAIESIDRVMHAVERRYFGSGTLFSESSPVGGAENLLYVIRDGLRAEDQRLERIRSGIPLPGDLMLDETL